MNCIVNGSLKELPENLTVEGLIELLGMSDGICAAEVDKKLVPKGERASVVLQDGQQVEIVSLIGGG
jgi:sulfur carrier protein